VMSIKTFLLAAAAAVGLLASASLHAAPVAWTNSSGTSTTFTWTNGANDNGLANDPLVSGSTFAFFPSLKAFTINSAPGTAGDVIRVTLVPNAGQRISGISADFFGDTTVLGQGAAGYSATLDAQKHGTSTHATSALTPPDITDQGAIADHLNLVVPDGFGKVDLSLALDLHATGTDAFTELKVVKFDVQTAPANVVPLPAAVVMAPAGAAVAAYAKRRMTRRA
jgi:hypothetical protein